MRRKHLDTSKGDPSEAFVAQIIESQRVMYTYVLTMLGDLVAADDVLQETNMVLWRKRDEFEPGTDFVAWAISVAHYQVLAYRKRRGRDRHAFSDSLLEQLSLEAPEHMSELSPKRAALAGCLAKLPAGDRELIDQRYAASTSVSQIAARLGRTVNAISTALHRIRASLLACIERSLSEDAK